MQELFTHTVEFFVQKQLLTAAPDLSYGNFRTTFPPSHGNTQSSDSSEASLHPGTHQHFYTLTQMTLLAGESCQCVVSLELCFWPEEGDTTVILARFWPTLHQKVLPPVRLLTPHNYRYIHHCVKIHSGGVKRQSDSSQR